MTELLDEADSILDEADDSIEPGESRPVTLWWRPVGSSAPFRLLTPHYAAVGPSAFSWADIDPGREPMAGAPPNAWAETLAHWHTRIVQAETRADVAEHHVDALRAAAAYPPPSEAAFEAQARYDLERLVAWLPSLSKGHLSVALEAMRLSRRSARAVEVLRGYIGDPHPFVREGAMLGLAGHLSSPEAREAMQVAAETDPAPELRERAAELLLNA